MLDNVFFHSCFRGSLKSGVMPVTGHPEEPVKKGLSEHSVGGSIGCQDLSVPF